MHFLAINDDPSLSYDKCLRTINVVLKSGLCTGCGTCAGICPQLAIQMTISKRRGIYLPHLDKQTCDWCGVCFDVCPGRGIDFNQLNSEIFGKQPEDILLGNYINYYVGHASDHDIRYNAASGGMVTALLIFALEHGVINGALVTRMRENNPLEPQPFIAKTREDIVSAAKSKYCPVPANIALNQILKEDGKFAVVGLPCHIHGIRKAEAVNRKLKDKIVLHLGIFCNHPMTFHGTGFLLDKYGVKQEHVARLDYRGTGWPGYMTIHLKDGTQKLIPFGDYGLFFWGLHFFTPARCALCCDKTAELADISCADAWLPEVEANDNIGTSLLVSRSRVGENLLEQAMSQGEVVLSTLGSDIIGRIQKDIVKKKAASHARLRMVSLVGKQLPACGIKLPKATFSVYLRSLLFYFHMYLSKRCFWWLITPLTRLEIRTARFIKSLKPSGWSLP